MATRSVQSQSKDALSQVKWPGFENGAPVEYNVHEYESTIEVREEGSCSESQVFKFKKILFTNAHARVSEIRAQLKNFRIDAESLVRNYGLDDPLMHSFLTGLFQATLVKLADLKDCVPSKHLDLLKKPDRM